jgi:hypothetical protein
MALPLQVVVDLCPSSAAFFGFMGVSSALVFASAFSPWRRAPRRAAPRRAARWPVAGAPHAPALPPTRLAPLR